MIEVWHDRIQLCNGECHLQALSTCMGKIKEALLHNLIIALAFKGGNNSFCIAMPGIGLCMHSRIAN